MPARQRPDIALTGKLWIAFRRSGIVPRLLLLPSLITALAILPCRAQTQLPLPADSSARGDLQHGGSTPPDSSAVPDTAGRMSTPELVGTLERNLDPGSFRTRNDLHWVDYRYLGNILQTFPGAFVREQSSEGQYSQLSFNGVDWRSIAVTMNGRPMNDPISGVFNLYLFTTEYADRIEVVTGPRAFLYGSNSTGGVVNLVTKNYNSNKPFTKLDYSEGADGYAYVDGTFSQNTSRRINLTFGFQHQGTDGRFPNSDDESWMGRSKLRYNVSRDFNVIFSYYYVSMQAGLNGGISTASVGTTAAFDALQAIVVNADSYEKITRHDLDLSLVGTFMGDSTDVTNLTLYHSHVLREYRDEENRIPSNGIFVHSDHLASWMGATLTQDIASEIQRFEGGASIEIRKVEASPNIGQQRTVVGALWGKEELTLSPFFSVAGFARHEIERGTGSPGAGADVTFALSPSFGLYGGFSSSRRQPNEQELFWNDSTVTRTGNIIAEKHFVTELGATLQFAGAGSIRFGYEHRTINDPILFARGPETASPFPPIVISNGSALTINSARASISVRFWYLAVEGTAMYLLETSHGVHIDDYPKLSGSGGLYFWHTLLHEKLELKAGVKGRFAFSHAGMLFNPEVIGYVPNGGTPVSTNGSADLFLIAHLGDAYIHVMWENIAGIQYYGTPYYPGGERALRFGVSWEFRN